MLEEYALSKRMALPSKGACGPRTDHKGFANLHVHHHGRIHIEVPLAGVLAREPRLHGASGGAPVIVVGVTIVTGLSCDVDFSVPTPQRGTVTIWWVH
jgi:hypothetical protein